MIKFTKHNGTKALPVCADEIVIIVGKEGKHVHLPVIARAIQAWGKVEAYAVVKLSYEGKRLLTMCKG